VADHGTATVGKDTTTTVASELSSEADRQTTLARVIDYYAVLAQRSVNAIGSLNTPVACSKVTPCCLHWLQP